MQHSNILYCDSET